VISDRDKRALGILALALLAAAAYVYWPESAPTAASPLANLPLDQVQQRLDRFRQTAASVGAKEDVLKTVNAQLAAREKGLIQADTAAQAQAQVIQIMRGLANAESVPVEIRSTELGPVAAFGDAYASVNVSMQMECRIEQLVNLLAAIGARPELIAPNDLRVTSSSPKEKTMGVRLTVMALAPRRLLPEKKGAL
jgi:hypothetical protein